MEWPVRHTMRPPWPAASITSRAARSASAPATGWPPSRRVRRRSSAASRASRTTVQRPAARVEGAPIDGHPGLIRVDPARLAAPRGPAGAAARHDRRGAFGRRLVVGPRRVLAVRNAGRALGDQPARSNASRSSASPRARPPGRRRRRARRCRAMEAGRSRTGRRGPKVARQIGRGPHRAVARHQFGRRDRRGTGGADQLERAGWHVVAVGHAPPGEYSIATVRPPTSALELPGQLIPPNPHDPPPGAEGHPRQSSASTACTSATGRPSRGT